MRSNFAIVCLLLSVSSLNVFADQELVVSAGDHDRSDVVVQVTLPQELQGGPVQLRDMGTGDIVPSQVDSPGRLSFVLPGSLPAGGQRRFTVETKAVPASENSMVCTEADGLLSVTSPTGLVLSYHTKISPPPPGVDPRYRRSGHIHPVTTPRGAVVTDEYPEDHLHQHALFNAWVNTEFAGKHVDFWNELKGSGRVEHRQVLETTSGPVWGGFRVELAHVALTDAPNGQDILREEWEVRCYNVRGARLFEIQSTQTCIAETPLTVNEYHYGGMAFRGSSQWNDRNADFFTSEGRSRSDGNHSRPTWVAIHGTVDGLPAGLAVFGHPDNFRHPQPVRLHPKMPYFVFSPPVLGEFELKPGEPYVSRYRYISFDGAPNITMLRNIAEDYAHPPSVKLVVTEH